MLRVESERAPMNLLTAILLVLLFVGLLLGLLWLGRHYGSLLTQRIAQVAVGVAILLAVVALLIWGLEHFGVLDTLSRVRVPGTR
jgi:succinate dehydrogenase hydrophobic anchor subunit